MFKQKKIFKLSCLLIVLLPCFLFSQTSYYHDYDNSVSIKNITSVNFTPFKNRINQGLKNGTYWIKIEQNKSSNSSLILEFPTTHIAHAEIYQNKQLIPEWKNCSYKTFEIKSNSSKYIYAKIIVEKEAYIPLRFIKKKNFLEYKQRNSIKSGFFYGFCLMVVILNLFYYINLKDNSFLAYSVFLISVCIVFGYRDGFFVFLGLSKAFIDNTEVFVHVFTGVTGGIGAILYLQMDRDTPKLILVVKFLFFVAALFYTFYFFLSKFIFFALGDLTTYLLYITCWVASVYIAISKRYLYATIFAFGYFFLALLTNFFFIFPDFGIPGPYISPNSLKLGGYVEMLFISFGIIFRLKTLKKENILFRSKIYNFASKINELENELENLKQGQDNSFSHLNLNEREIQILERIHQKKTNREISEEIHISVNTVKYHIKKLYDKLEINSREEAVLKTREIRE